MALIVVGMAELKIASSPDTLVTRGLGSCVGIAMYGSYKKIGALAHAMVPLCEKGTVKNNPAKFVDSVILLMIDELKQRGCVLRNLKAKIFGGAHMFSSIPMDSPFNIGVRNVNVARSTLSSQGIELLADDTGGNYGRTIFFDLDTGKVKVKTIFHGEKEL